VEYPSPMTLTLTAEQLNDLQDETVRICQELIQIPSVNFGEGKGDEKAVAEYVAGLLSEVGIKSELIETAPNRVNVVAEIEGADSERPGLVLHGHIDVVPANADDWSVDPFSGLIKDGAVWGRGAVDMKNMDAMILAIIRLWARIGYKPPRRLVLAFFADEEAGSIYGSRWIAKNRPEIFAGCSEAVSEVGGFSLTLPNGKRLYLIETAEKGINWMKLTATGTASHGSMITTDNAVVKLAGALDRIGNYPWPERATKTASILMQRVAETMGEPFDPNNLRSYLKYFGGMAKMIGATLQNTANPSMLEAGYKTNVVPQSATAVVDGRFLPGFEAEMQETIKGLLGEGVEVEMLTRDIALEFDFTGPLVDAMCAAIISEDPEGTPVPFLMSGGTDNKALSDLGITGYGFSPLKIPADLDFMSLFHGVDERVPVESLHFGVRALHHFLINS
jgi:acetylornithine deacetylase/succinyl-diaminopimelate desuccinylase-like protein